ncbi:MAG: 4Fe-4S dicluster domain-containing protein [Candidatus Lokiarchaeota archaeon]|nr:4Fe-4S dicluster domain-containing protein [Candidatus Lokiarchaeota archaeon]
MVLDKVKEEYIGSVMVIGAGVAGIQASLDLADLGFRVYLVEKSLSVGGRMSQLDKTFPTNDCSLCILAPKMIEVNRHENIELLTYHEVLQVDVDLGNYIVQLLKKARYVDEEKCRGCGDCSKACPTVIPNDFDMGIGKRKAIDIPFPQAVPLVYQIDSNYCIKLTKGKCGICHKVCETGAINYDQKDEIIELKVGAIIVATGFELFDINKIPSFGYHYDNVITALEYERLMSASGPTGGHIVRLSDHKEPEKIAFISCVGSRSVTKGVPYCSNVCCMYIAKECIITKEHAPDIDCYVFKSDVRAFGKGFNEFVERAKSDYDVKYIDGRIGKIEEDPINKDLILYYEDLEDQVNKKIRVQMVVLAVALIPSEGSRKLAEILDINIDNYGFYNSLSEINPLETEKKGIYICGYGEGPKDIPDSVAQGSAAAAKCAEFLSSVKGTLIKKKILSVKEKEISLTDPPRIGIIVCKCGTNIGGIVDVYEVVDYIRKIPGVIVAESNLYSCSDSTRSHIKEMIEDHDLNRFIVASCTPRTHDALFRQTCQEAGLNQYLFELVNIRDQCSWVHMDVPELATEKAKKLIEMTIAKSKLLRPIKTIKTKIKSGCIIIGGGITGLTAALSVAEQGFQCYIIEENSDLGGNLNELNSIYPSFKSPDSFLERLKEKVMKHNNIRVFLNHSLFDVSGSVGNFNIKIKSKNDHKITTIQCATIIVAVGAKEFKPKGYYNYGNDERIITQLELESLLKDSGSTVLNQDYLIQAKNIAMIQCVGAREKNGRSYCSKVCCLSAIKNAIVIKDRYLEKNIYIFYRDIVLPGKDTEELYRKAREKGVTFIKYEVENPPEIKAEQDHILIELGRENKLSLKAGLIVLSTPLIPTDDYERLSQILKVPVSKDLGGFFLEAHVKLRPLDFATDGIYICGSARFPSNIEDSISQALGAASRAGIILSKDSLTIEGIISEVNHDLCIGCGTCKDICPYNAIEMIPVKRKTGEINVSLYQSQIIEQLCKGCGKCVSACPVQAIQAKHFTNTQILEMIKTCTTK